MRRCASCTGQVNSCGTCASTIVKALISQVLLLLGIFTQNTTISRVKSCQVSTYLPGIGFSGPRTHTHRPVSSYILLQAQQKRPIQDRSMAAYAGSPSEGKLLPFSSHPGPGREIVIVAHNKRVQLPSWLVRPILARPLAAAAARPHGAGLPDESAPAAGLWRNAIRAAGVCAGQGYLL